MTDPVERVAVVCFQTYNDDGRAWRSAEPNTQHAWRCVARAAIAAMNATPPIPADAEKVVAACNHHAKNLGFCDASISLMAAASVEAVRVAAEETAERIVAEFYSQGRLRAWLKPAIAQGITTALNRLASQMKPAEGDAERARALLADHITVAPDGAAWMTMEIDLISAFAAVRAEERERAIAAIRERRDSYDRTHAPGWHEVVHECDQCVAAIEQAAIRSTP